MWPPSSTLARAARAAWLAGALAGCAVGPDYHRPPAPDVTHYVHGGDPTASVTAHGAAQRFTPGAQVSADWWRVFGSPALQQLIERSLAANPGLAAAQASLRESEDNLRAGYGIFFPQVAATAGASRQRTAPLTEGLGGIPNSLFNLFTLSGSVDYALDIFGGQRRLVEQLGAQVDLQRATEQAAYLTLVSNVVNTVIARAAYQAEVQATEELIGLQREQVRLAQVQVGAGTEPYSTVLSLQSQLDSYQASIPQLEQRVAQSEDLLATLTGQPPAGFAAPAIRLADLHLPGALPVSLPSTLLGQRPDILVAEATAHAASAAIGVATAAMLPNVTLHGGYNANSTTAANLFAAAGRTWQFGSDISQPLFEGGTLWYKRKAAIDTYRQAAALYRQTVLGAFQQVADTLQALANDASALQAEDEALDSAGQALHLVQTNYVAGLDTYLDVLNADAQYHQAQIADLQAIATRYQDTVALYVALGGGWWPK